MSVGFFLFRYCVLLLLLPSARYLQYQLTLSTSDTSITPTFDDVTITYR